jgi:hypothetical protein
MEGGAFASPYAILLKPPQKWPDALRVVAVNDITRIA